MSNNNNIKVKGLLRGLRFISQIFDNEKQEDIQIGHPTDVKHVAHIGWQGPSESSPSWMNEFKSVPGLSSSAPLDINGEILSDGPDNSAKWVSEDSIKRNSRSVNSHGREREMPELPKSSRKHVIGNMKESNAKERSDRPRQHKKSSKQHSHQQKDATTTTSNNGSSNDTSDSLQIQRSGELLQHRNIPHNPKRTCSIRTKDGSGGGSGSSKTRSRSHQKDRDSNSDKEYSSRSSSKCRSKNRSFEDQEQEMGSTKQLITN